MSGDLSGWLFPWITLIDEGHFHILASGFPHGGVPCADSRPVLRFPLFGKRNSFQRECSFCAVNGLGILCCK